MYILRYVAKPCQSRCKVFIILHRSYRKFSLNVTKSIKPTITRNVVSVKLVPHSSINVEGNYTGNVNKTENSSWCQNEELDWQPVVTDWNKVHLYYMKLAKIRLTGLVVFTTMAGYALAPAPLNLTTFLCCSLGTGLVSGAANAINQYHEVPFDAQMSRTKNRILVRSLVTPLHALAFANVSTIMGLSLLYYGCNGLTAALAASNLLLYTCIYTPMKRISILNTWVGAVVGAMPPVMGWVACTGSMDAGSLVLAGILYAWQFAHFNALSWNLRPDYSRAGYRMMAVTNPGLCRRTALRYTAALIGISFCAPLCGITNLQFILESLPLNIYFTYLAWRFYKESDSSNSRKLFRFSLVHLPLLMIMMFVNRKPWYCLDNENGSDFMCTVNDSSSTNVTVMLPETSITVPNIKKFLS